MMHFIDISNHQKGMDLSKVLPSVGGVVCKATEGIGFVDAYCDKFVQTCIRAGKPWGFYHFNGTTKSKLEADFFVRNCENYFGEGIPILDWETIYRDGVKYEASVEWVNEFVNRVHDLTGVWPWIYGNPWRFEQGDVEANCGRWLAHYFNDDIRTFSAAEKHERPSAPGLVCAWQFTSKGRVSGYSGNLDLDLFYGDADAWMAYARGARVEEDVSEPVVLEGDGYRVTIEEV